MVVGWGAGEEVVGAGAGGAEVVGATEAIDEEGRGLQRLAEALLPRLFLFIESATA